MYQKVSADMKFVEREKEIEQFWKDRDIFNKSVSIREGKETYMFYDGPPTANGKPHIGHVLTRAIKDMIPRYRTMKGYYVPRKAGWDTHGLPVELEVEKDIGISGKDQIEDYGIEPFIKKCRESVWTYKGMWEDFSGTVGFWADMDHPYITYEDDYIESEWWALSEIWKKKLLYKGFKVVPYCPRCGTPLSSHEVAQGYKKVKERSAIVRFKAKDEDAYFLAWTTTPWTLLSNVALCVNPDETYAKVKAADGNTYYMAKALLDSVLGEEAGSYTILEEMQGKALEYKSYEPLYDCTAEAAAKRKGEKAFIVTCDSYVTMEDGTGIVHTAPAFGEDDARVGRAYEIAFVQMVDEKGVMLDVTPFAGMRAKPNEDEIEAGIKSADPEIIADLKANGKLLKAPQFEHDYPHCWRCETPLLYYARESWFIKETAVKEDLIRNNNMINWVPKSIGSGRFGDWLENIQDWAISRNRYWGTPLNIWECEGCGHQISVGSREELASLTGDGSALSVELHRPYIDRYMIKCPECGENCRRVPEVIDCWFDSGAMPFAQLHYPFENKELFEENWFPASFISEAVDQTRGWFHSLHAISTLLFNKPCFENVVVLGLVQDENGQKMSKSKGNAVDPFEALETYGADAIRWYFYTNSAPWLPSRFSGKAVQEGERKFLSTFWNTYAFFVLYANIDGFDAAQYLKIDGQITGEALHAACKKALAEAQLTVMDRWILSRMNTMIRQTDEALDQYKIPEAGRSLLQFTDDLSNWYVRRCRERFWAAGMEADKIAAYLTLYSCLISLAQAAAPMTPFITEAVYRNLVCESFPEAPESVHLTEYPVCDEAMIDQALEDSMALVMEIVVLGRASRNAANIKNRQPVQSLYVRTSGGTDKGHGELASDENFVSIIREELNVKEVVFTEDVREFTSYTFKPQLKTVGPKYGKQLGGIKEHLASLDGNAAMDELNAEGALKFSVAGTEVALTKEDLLIDTAQKEGFMSQEENGVTVVLDCNLMPELIEEGIANEIVSKVQTSRKDAGFEVTDRIRLSVTGAERVIEVLKKNADFIGNKVLADEILYDRDVPGAKEWDINGEKAKIGVEKI
ncbi:MAG: isoleucine--tRNA ligase [Lachnospiraceae bacterium]|nr:isoleucine--tRNA ligase [Lachnospiraceae bacterium]